MMLKILQIGSCRLSLRPVPIKKFRFNKFLDTFHTASQIQQLIRFFQGETIPSNLVGLIFNRKTKAGEITDEEIVAKVDKIRSEFNTFDGFVVEVCSLKNTLSNNYYLHSSCSEEALKDVPHERFFDTAETLPAKVLQIADMLKKPVVFATHQNRANLYSRSVIIKAMQQLGVVHFDPTPIVLEHGFENMMLDENHYTEAMHSHVLAGITAKLEQVFQLQ